MVSGLRLRGQDAHAVQPRTTALPEVLRASVAVLALRAEVVSSRSRVRLLDRYGPVSSSLNPGKPDSTPHGRLVPADAHGAEPEPFYYPASEYVRLLRESSWFDANSVLHTGKGTP